MLNRVLQQAKLFTQFGKFFTQTGSISSMHILSSSFINLQKNIITNYLNPITLRSTIVAPVNLQIIQTCGFKVKGRLKKRCKDCYFVVRKERNYVICKTHPRHKQMAMKKDADKTWILTHATQSPVRPW